MPAKNHHIFRWQTGEAMYEAGILNNVIGSSSIRESVVRKTLCKSATPYGKRMFEAVLQRLKDLGVIEAVPHGLKENGLYYCEAKHKEALARYAKRHLSLAKHLA